MEHAKISHQNISRGIFAFVFGALLFLLLATLILETSGLEIILFLSQNEDSVNTKCKVELREVLQQVVSLHWNKCWFVQKKKKSMPLWILLVLTFYFLSLLKKCVLLTSAICSPSCEALQEDCSSVHSQQMCWTCCARGWSGTCAGHTLEAREWVIEIQCTQILCLASSSAVWSGCFISELFHTFLFSKSLF